MLNRYRFISVVIAILMGIFSADSPGGEYKFEIATNTTILSFGKLTFGYVAAVQDPFMVLIQNGAMDIQEKQQVMDLIRDLKAKGVTTIIISHEMQDVFEIADRIVVIYQGQCVAVKEKNKTTIEEIANLIITGQGA